MKKSKKSKHSIKRKVITALVAMSLALGAFSASRKSDQFIFNRVVMLSSDTGSCSGEQVRAPSGKDYVLTAAHCKVILNGANAKLVAEDGKEFPAVFLAEDPNSDLMLMQGLPDLSGLPVAYGASDREDIRTFTHGRGYKAYKTEGTLVGLSHIDVEVDIILTQEDMDACESMPKNHVDIADFYLACIMSVDAMVSTAFVAPGSSGGAAVNSSGELIGVVSASGGGFAIFVALDHIHAFLSDK